MASETMSRDRFWSIIDQTAPLENNPEMQLESLQLKLKALPIEDIVAFDHALDKEMARANSWDLWGAAYLIHGGASNDGFVYFRLWLISKGRDLFEATLLDPDGLAEADVTPGPDGVYELEELMYSPWHAWAEKSGRDYFDFPKTGGSQIGLGRNGTDFDFDDEQLATRYPKLWKRFGKNPLP